PHAVAMKIQELWGKAVKEEPQPALQTVNRPAKIAQLQVAGVSGLLTSLANCCCPLPGDEIVGFISRGKGAIVHRADCKNIDRYRQRDRERLVNVSWTTMAQSHYLAPAVITAHDRSGLIRDIAMVVSDAGVNMTSVDSHVAPGKEQAIITATFEIESLEQMHRLFLRLEKVKGIMGVERDLGNKRKRV
ncbi:MAG TPA: ACT domain-containing protein, partial [Ktedonobacteraceae bacterium]|nr:ACT domain-containing protein [Ktedonobacteraceae bacterium]